MTTELTEELKTLRKTWEEKERKATTAHIAATRAFGNFSRALMKADIIEEPVPKRGGGKRKEAEAAPIDAPAVVAASSEPPKKKGRGKKAAAVEKK